MYTAFAQDLKVARRKSGLSQRDCAHLLDIPRNRYAKLEKGVTTPTTPEICGLSIVFAKSFQSLFGTVFAQARITISEHLQTLPEIRRGWLGKLNRNHSLNQLAERLTGDSLLDRGRL